MSSLKGQLLYLINDRQGLLFKRSAFYIVDFQNNTTDLITNVPISSVKRFLGNSRLMNRFLRLEPRCAERLADNKFLVCYAHKVWLLDIDSKKMTELWSARDGFSNPLNFCSDGNFVYWGDYGNNTNREIVNIYRAGLDLRVDVVYSFSPRTVRHIHNVVWDKVNMRFFVLTGDLEDTSGIYVSDGSWNTVQPVVTGKQQYRAVAAFPCGDGLIYVTDSVAEDNNIYLLQHGEVKVLAPFPGSCIYGTEIRDYYVFSSTVEPPEGRGFFNMFTYKIGAGIKDRYAHLIKVRKSDLKVEEVHKSKKDVLPMKLFQYGSLIFPHGQDANNLLWYYTVACKGDGITNKLQLG